MSIKISDVFNGLVSQQVPALVTILTAAKAYAAETGVDDSSLLDTRLHEDMHPLSWQIQTTLELVTRGMARLSGEEPAGLELDEDNFDSLISRVKTIQSDLSNLEAELFDRSADTIIEIPVGPDASLKLTGKDYVVKFLLPNVYFHLTTAYDILRMKGVPLGKRDYMGPF